uniref:OLD protein-like TOPRIM domain-containing protein n=1 Tax=Candidatus Methanogaster sp. ANME-2c ERB4 TaxID=2759911 RepID=A0A7G9YBM0_9EURY|nr:hypothetical protein PLMKAGEE_00001 [Methanosarcinales archaeon ANME-2c ERB4]
MEGDAENLLIPTIAEIIGRPLAKHGVSIVNVGSTAFLRYSRIFQRENLDEFMGMPVAIITDCDIKPNRYYEDNGKDVPDSEYLEQIKRAIVKKQDAYTGRPVKTFVSPYWTLEYVIALSDFKKEFYRAVLQAGKIKNSNQIGLTEAKEDEINKDVETKFKEWRDGKFSDEKIAFEIYNNFIIGKEISKAIIAQCFAKILSEYFDREDIAKKLLGDDKFGYIIDAINYATSENVNKAENADD